MLQWKFTINIGTHNVYKGEGMFKGEITLSILKDKISWQMLFGVR